MKIAVIGYSGAGKSTLARELGLRFVCEVLRLDSINFISGWRERDRKEALALVSAFMPGIPGSLTEIIPDFFRSSGWKRPIRSFFWISAGGTA